MAKERRRALGDAGEEFAAAALAKAGYRVIGRNLAIGGGEIDILAEHEGMLVVVEVKTRTGASFGSAAEAITRAKALRLARAAEAYLASRRLDRPVRCDLVAIDLDASGAEPRIEILPGVIDLTGARQGRRWRM